MDHTRIDVIVGVDMAKADHFAQAITMEGVELFARSLANDQADIEACDLLIFHMSQSLFHFAH